MVGPTNPAARERVGVQVHAAQDLLVVRLGRKRLEVGGTNQVSKIRITFFYRQSIVEIKTAVERAGARSRISAHQENECFSDGLDFILTIAVKRDRVVRRN
jgi:hypothetical protein